ncbi:MAG: XrtA system polysaccharide deacetylase [Gemmatimonadota bacterium]
MHHHFTVDVEEYFHPTAMGPTYPFESWDSLPRRAPTAIPPLLDLLERRGVTGTFFVLGWLAEREPEMVRAIAERGHEIASHGWEHDLVGRLGPDRFRESVARSRDVLEQISGARIDGYRAPSFSIVPGLEWAFDILLEEGYTYDASLFPVSTHPTYGYPEADRDPFWIDRPNGRLLEFPSTTVKWAGRTLPASGGAYFRLLPPIIVHAGMKQSEERGAPGMFYVHPWEWDDWAPEVLGSRLQWIRTFHGRRRVFSRMDALLGRFDFGPIRPTVDRMADADSPS